ncbi:MULTISPECIES: UDP-2,4-diacetamido-2,4,6-trideoxy-beta-L-altropyranose hydrolase [Aeromonas]|uniref:UDP-2,4-diacetamido-2,4, 6-trideoxy-beta-L-altropyranose hydrolase n=1 Tax=Aeromonas TaxID=642 RepID=UPI0029D7BE1B|nr:UDP-2,4-diacetamido-2,4,6-trideoxy-beta-L-altropyranose hydrolase [Aeromonas caviae]MDX7784989.1 UDP-2,4-diacetamido-2,4,6-trideoxy-beta-L-altropyranose hydrolase [Aeromonas caviae]MDX7850460.1 UDP-2,4-diacetamido-2,4,6-trideoxy-beta-L-altropyranose hydrolase [Aeromonas caviae]
MKFFIRTDASRWIGSGHVMRCLVLADGLKSAGHQVTFICRPQDGDLLDLIAARNHNLLALPSLTTVIRPEHGADYSSWLQVPWQQDAADVLESVVYADWLIVDHYGINAQWEREIRLSLNCKVLSIDDLVRPHDADLILDQTLDRTPEAYFECFNISDKQPVVLSGVAYALLSSQFGKIRNQGILRAPASRQPRILLSFGGIDEPNVTLRVLKALSEFNAVFTVLLSPRAPHYQAVKTWCDDRVNVVHYDFIQDMATLMSEHDLAIGAPGTTTWERACLGLPNIVIPIAENQQAICQALLAHQAALLVQQSDIESRLIPALHDLLNNYKEYVDNNLELCDGKGAQRVINTIMANTEISGFRLRPVSIDDTLLIYQWQSDPITRRYALNPNPPSWVEHKSWMEKKIQCQQDYFFLIINAESSEPCGAVRLDELGTDNYLISIFVAPNKHGQGIGLTGLKLLDRCLPKIRIHATVLTENIASQRLFSNAGYQQVAPDKFIREPLWTK